MAECVLYTYSPNASTFVSYLVLIWPLVCGVSVWVSGSFDGVWTYLFSGGGGNVRKCDCL